jgi:hypothetical protein
MIKISLGRYFIPIILIGIALIICILLGHSDLGLIIWYSGMIIGMPVSGYLGVFVPRHRGRLR